METHGPIDFDGKALTWFERGAACGDTDLDALCTDMEGEGEGSNDCEGLEDHVGRRAEQGTRLVINTELPLKVLYPGADRRSSTPSISGVRHDELVGELIPCVHSVAGSGEDG
jgi:hypothetical protein